MSDETLVTQLRALGVIYAGWARLLPDVGYIVDAAAGMRPTSDPLHGVEDLQMWAQLELAVETGHAELIGEPDEHSYRQLRLTDAGIAVLDQEQAEQPRTVRYVVDSRLYGREWELYSEGTTETTEQDPNAIARAVAVGQGIPPGTGAFIAYNATVRVRVWTDPATTDGPASGEYVHDVLAEVRERNSKL